jgi:ABC-2 type transport system permease protein
MTDGGEKRWRKGRFADGSGAPLFAAAPMRIFPGHDCPLDAAVRPAPDARAAALQMLSGRLTQRESMPEPVQFVMLAAPTTHFVLLAQAILYRGAGLATVWPQFLALAAIGSVFFGYALSRFRATIGTMA